MVLLSSLEELAATTASDGLPPPPTALAIGVFDGVHRAHRALLERTIDESRSLGPEGRAAVLTFSVHPESLFSARVAPPLLTPLHRRYELLAELGIELVVAIPFTREFASLPAEDFLRRVVVGQFGARALVCGPDFRFGQKRTGSLELIEKLGGELRLRGVPVSAKLCEDGTPINSTRIRALLREGDVIGAGRLLGRPHEIEGVVVTGSARGRLIGFPTANLDVDPALALPRRGVYAVDSAAPGPVAGGMMNIGLNPTFGDIERLRVEVHLFDYSGDLVGRRLRIRVRAPLREERKFSGVEELTRQLHSDRDAARAALAGAAS